MTFGNWLLSTARRRTIQAKILNDPYYRLQSAEEIAVAADLGIKIDVNQASVDDWLRLPGLSIHQARSLVDISATGVQFHCIEDIAAAIAIPVARLKPLEPLLSFCYYDLASSDTIKQINANSVSVENLTKIPGIDLVLAKAVVENRDRYGPYRHLADFQNRLQLSTNLTSQLMYYLRF